VRDNLGITFVPVERRVVAGTLRMPGRFESTPEARAEYRAPARGTVTFAVRQYQRVAAGDVLYRLDSPALREVQGALMQAELAADLLRERRRASDDAVAAARRAAEVHRARVTRLAALLESGVVLEVQVAEAEADLSSAESALADVLESAQQLRLEAAELDDPVHGNRRFALALREAALLTGRSEQWLLAEVDGKPRWRALDAIEITARRSGVVSGRPLADGSRVADGDLVLEALDPGLVRFRGFGLQADLSSLRDGSPVRIVPPHGNAWTHTESIPATLTLATEADPEERTIDLVAAPGGDALPAWARPGVAAFLEVVVAGSEEDTELAIPLAAVAADGLDRVFFLRDRANPDQVRRVEADLGADDGRWIVVNSGVRPGDQVVLDGVYELMLTGSGKVEQGGHFHADGTFHAGEH
jgi:multidrug resistance efflux pump